jgi:hypothetical protein
MVGKGAYVEAPRQSACAKSVRRDWLTLSSQVFGYAIYIKGNADALLNGISEIGDQRLNECRQHI